MGFFHQADDLSQRRLRSHSGRLELEQALLVDGSTYDLVAWSLKLIGVTQRVLGEYAAAVESLTRSLALSEESGNRREMAIVSLLLGNAHVDRGELRQARSEHTRSLELYRELGQSALAGR